MTDKKSQADKPSEYLPIPTVLRGNLRAFLITASIRRGAPNLYVYYVLEKGKLFLCEEKDVLGSRSIEIKMGDIICLWRDRKIGREEFGGYLNESGKSISNVETKHKILDGHRKWVQYWCESKREMLSMIREGKLKLSKEVLDVKSIRIPKEVIKRKLGIDIEDDIFVSSDKEFEDSSD